MTLIHRIQDFSGGLNLSKGGYELAPNEASYCNNAIPNKEGGPGGLSKIPGNSTKLTLDERICGLKVTRFNDGTENFTPLQQAKYTK